MGRLLTKIKLPDGSIHNITPTTVHDFSDLSDVGKKKLDGRWVMSNYQICNGKLSSTTSTFNVSSYVPNDGCLYEVIFMWDVWDVSSNVFAYVYTDFMGSVPTAMSQVMSSKRMRGTCNLVLGPQRIFYINSNAYYLNHSLHFRGYKRIGEME